MTGFESVSDIPRLGAAYARNIATQLDLAMCEIQRGCLSPGRKSEIRRNRRWLEGLTAEALSRRSVA